MALAERSARSFGVIITPPLSPGIADAPGGIPFRAVATGFVTLRNDAVGHPR